MLDNNDIEELKRYFAPKIEIVSVLPNPKSVEDNKKVLLQNDDGTYTEYTLIKGYWYKPEDASEVKLNEV